MVIINYWLLLTPAFETDTNNVLPIIKDRNPREDGPAVSSSSVQFPLLNVLREDTKQMLRHFPRRYGGDFLPGLWNCYARADGLWALPSMREELQALQAAYPDNFDVGGCWVYDTGEPVGGVGSPWFCTPPNLADYLPSGMVEDVILSAGQAKRVFI